MAKKAELLEQAQKHGLSVTEKNTIAEIESAINDASRLHKDGSKTAKAKAGKHSAKGVKESTEKLAKIERQHHRTEVEDEQIQSAQPKIAIKPTRPKIERRGKKYQEVSKLIDRNKEYTLADAVELALKTSPSKFDASVELHIKLGVDPRQADQNIRGTVSLPAGTGKTIKVAVYANEDDIKSAKNAGADIAGSDDFLQELEKQNINFDVLITTPQMMSKLSKYARLLGPKGLMPNPKSGTVAKDIVTAVKDAKAGKVEYRVDSTGIIHMNVGKSSFSATDLRSNISAVTNTIKSAKPASIKGSFIQSVYLTTTMGPSIKVQNTEI